WDEERSAPEADTTGRSHASIRNPEEATFTVDRVRELMAAHPQATVGVIAPYRAQVTLLEDLLHSEVVASEGRLTIQTVDGFQGQERDIMVIGLTRSNAEGTVGFLAEHRRMNVAMTRARMHLLVIGDSATLGTDDFYAGFTQHCENTGAYRSCWEWV
ncbi:MAG: C-terminal helicase domain-containing protein, partial [Flavobacteriales bacterium]